VPDSLKKDSSEIDVNSVKGPVEVNGKVLDSPAVESKHLDPDKYGTFTSKQEITDLVKKLTAQAGSGEKEILVVTTKEFYGQYESQLKKISRRVKNRLRENGLESDVTIEISTYDEIDN